MRKFYTFYREFATPDWNFRGWPVSGAFEFQRPFGNTLNTLILWHEEMPGNEPIKATFIYMCASIAEDGEE